LRSASPWSRFGIDERAEERLSAVESRTVSDDRRVDIAD
jgi:hypothetical protein